MRWGGYVVYSPESHHHDTVLVTTVNTGRRWAAHFSDLIEEEAQGESEERPLEKVDIPFLIGAIHGYGVKYHQHQREE